jgi:hypothetical protein
MGILWIFYKKLRTFSQAQLIKKEYNYKNADFKKFIESENARVYRGKYNIELVGGELGKWLEFWLPETVEDKKIRERVSELLKN